MRKPFGSILGCCAAALPLVGCAGGLAPMPPETGPPPAAVATATPEPGIYTARGMAPAAVLVFVPGAVAFGDVAAGDPAVWAAQGFDVVMPRPTSTALLVADQQAAVERLLASARALADAPVWLVGPSRAIEAVMPRLGLGRVSGVVVTLVTSTAGSCTRTMYYANSGTGAEPRAVVKTSGDACGASPSFGASTPAGVVPVPHVKPAAPRLIEASMPADPAAQRPVVQRLAEELKATQAAS